MLPAAHVDLWLAREGVLREPTTLARLAGVLSDEERAQVGRIRFADPRDQRLITRALARCALSNYLPTIAPAAWRFDRTELGKPSVASGMPPAARELHFNLAHTQGLVVMAVSRLPDLGVDAERITPTVPMDVARRYFTAREMASLEALPEEDRPRRFQRLWTLKEAYLKAVGSGIRGGLDSMTFDCDADPLRFEHEDDPLAARWQFHELIVDDAWLLALACLDRATMRPASIAVRDFSGQEQRAET